MKDITIRKIPREAVYKDVVIIGNGPSGISLSYMLSGNWPYWNTEKIQKHPDEFLRARLNYSDNSKSLVEHNLIELAEGLEGRSTNPVSLLLDSLEHPCADFGLELPSMIEYKNNSNPQIDHIVLGKGPPGGSWHRMDPKLRTLSLAAWMSLPGLSFHDWETQQLQKELNDDIISNLEQQKTELQDKPTENLLLLNNTNNNNKCSICSQSIIKSKLKLKFQQNENNIDYLKNSNNNEFESGALCCKCTKASEQQKQQPINTTKVQSTLNVQQENIINNDDDDVNLPPRRNLSLKRLISKEVQTRALVSRVAQYYEDYVRIMNLMNNFKNDAVVTLIAPIQNEIAALNCCGKIRNAKWIVTGLNKITGRPFFYACKNVVLANGASDLANRLGLRGENLKKSWVKHELPELENDLENLSEKELKALKPVLIVGAGLSAADAVTICRSSGIPVIHVFRSQTVGLDKTLPENVYPEYHEVHRMMKESKNVYDYYTPIPEHTISDLSTNLNGVHRVTVRHLITGETRTYDVSYCAILIGSRPDLRFTSCINKYPTKSNTINTQTTTATDQLIPSPSLSRKISWFKNLCAKCKHLNICDWNLRYKLCNKTCECTNQGKIFWDKDTNKGIKLCYEEDSGIGLGIDPTKSIDSKSNQIDVDKYTNEIQRTQKGLYAMGPLVGDNFVRFIPGGALAITAALNREND